MEEQVRKLDNYVGCLLIAIIILIIGGCSLNDHVKQLTDRVEVLEKNSKVSK
jgi:hypothetical protein